MDTTLKIYLLFHLTYCSCIPVDYSSEALKLLELDNIKSPTLSEKALAKKLVFERNEVRELHQQLALALHEKKVAQMKLCLRPTIEGAGKLVVPRWLRGRDWFSQTTTWVISMALGLTPVAIMLKEDLTSQGISLPEFEYIFGCIYGDLSKTVAHEEGMNVPEDLKEEDWEEIYTSTGLTLRKNQITLRTIFLTLDRFNDMQYLQYTTTTVTPRVHHDIILLIREKLPFKGDGNVESWESTFRGWCGLNSTQKIDNIYFPLEEKNKKFNKMICVRMNNFDGNIVEVINNLKKSVSKPELEYALDGSEGFKIPEELLK